MLEKGVKSFHARFERHTEGETQSLDDLRMSIRLTWNEDLQYINIWIRLR